MNIMPTKPQRYFPDEFPTTLKYSRAMVSKTPAILFLLSTTCSHCQMLLDRIISSGTIVRQLYFVYDCVTRAEILAATGIDLNQDVPAFPHAVQLNTVKPTVLPLVDLHRTVFGAIW